MKTTPPKRKPNKFDLVRVSMKSEKVRVIRRKMPLRKCLVEARRLDFTSGNLNQFHDAALHGKHNTGDFYEGNGR